MKNPDQLIAVDDNAGDTVTLFYRGLHGDVKQKQVHFEPFFLVHDDEVSDLSGGLHWNRKVTARRYLDLVKIRKTYDYEDYYMIPGISRQYLTMSGTRLFKGLEYHDLKRLQLDIETYSPPAESRFPDAEERSDYIFMVALGSREGGDDVLVLDRSMDVWAAERKLLLDTIRYIQRFDPDVIEMHNGLGFDMDYLMIRCRLHQIPFGIGRDGSEPRGWKSKKKFAEREFEYTNYSIFGRHIIDTMFLAADFDVFSRDLPGLGLKVLARHFNISPEDRAYVEGDDIGKLWDNDPATLARYNVEDGPALLAEYAKDDVMETRGLAERLGMDKFYLTQLIPMTYQQASLSGTASRIEAMLVAGYLKAGHSLPERTYGNAQEHGGYTDIFKRGVFRDVIYADVASLYPSIMLNCAISPGEDKDPLGYFQKGLQWLTNKRFYYKGLWKEAVEAGDTAKTLTLKAAEQAYKKEINSHYGMLGDQWSIFNNAAEADRVATTGQGILKRIIEIIESHGYEPIECDTDGIMFHHPDPSRQDVDFIMEKINAGTPDWVNVELEGVLDAMLSFRKKNYAILQDGVIKLKGGGFKSRSYEPIFRDYMEHVVELLLAQDVQGIADYHRSTLEAIVNKRVPVERLAKSSYLHKNWADYSAGSIKLAPYEIAGQLGTKLGTKVRFYVGGYEDRKARLKVYAYARSLEDYTPGDENVYFYVQRLKKVAEKFKVYFPKGIYETVFNTDPASLNQSGMFGEPDFSKVQISTTVRIGKKWTQPE